MERPELEGLLRDLEDLQTATHMMMLGCDMLGNGIGIKCLAVIDHRLEQIVDDCGKLCSGEN